MNIKHRDFMFLCFLFIIVLLPSCLNQSDIDKVNKFKNSEDSLPTEIIYDFSSTYSEEGYIKFILNSPKAINWGEKGVLEFPEGFEVTFYDNDMSKKSYLSADYGENNEEKRIMKAEYNVEIKNYKSEETLNTELMMWNQDKKLIYTDKFVKITTKDDIIYGDGGFESDEEFNVWTIKKPYGDFSVNEDD